MNSTQIGASYPRTGRRGVPQQFPIKLYGMLESEAEKAQSSSDTFGVIRWSESGKAFHIEDSVLFASLVLPKYFRTSKFSSFQRNLNLYGFSKVKRGIDTDMYAHSSFIRGRPDLLVHLKKSKSLSAEETFAHCSRKSSTVGSNHLMYDVTTQDMNIVKSLDHFTTSPTDNQQIGSNITAAIAGNIWKMCGSSYNVPSFLKQTQSCSTQSTSAPIETKPQSEDSAQTPREVSRSPTTTGSDDISSCDETAFGSPFGKSRDGKLDLLTFAVTCLEDSRVYR